MKKKTENKKTIIWIQAIGYKKRHMYAYMQLKLASKISNSVSIYYYFKFIIVDPSIYLGLLFLIFSNI